MTRRSHAETARAQQRRQLAEQFLAGLSQPESSSPSTVVDLQPTPLPLDTTAVAAAAVATADAENAAVVVVEDQIVAAGHLPSLTRAADQAETAPSVDTPVISGAGEKVGDVPLGDGDLDDLDLGDDDDDDDEGQERNRRRLIAAEFLTGLVADEQQQQQQSSAAHVLAEKQSGGNLSHIQRQHSTMASLSSLLFRKQMERADRDTVTADDGGDADINNDRKQSLLAHHLGDSVVDAVGGTDRQSVDNRPPSVHSAGALDRSGRTSVSTKRPYILHNMDQLQLQLPEEILQAHEARFFVCTATYVPFALFSVIQYDDDDHHGAGRRKKLSSLNMDKISGGIDHIKRRKGESFAHLLGPSVPGLYNPVDLDDPELKTGKHRTVISLPCYVGSVIQFTRPSDLRNELNDQFRQKHPQLDAGITLSKIRNLKTSLLEVTLAEDLELSSLAKCFAYFEKLVLKNYVNKSNRKLIAGTCMLLAAKINDKKESDYVSLLQTIEKHLLVSPKLIREHEFSVFAALEFSLHVDTVEYMPHLERLITLLDYNNLQEYLLGKPPANRNPVFI